MAQVLQQMSHRQLYRSRNAYIGGVCAGIADYYDVDALVIRILAVLLLLVSFGLAGVAYLVLWEHLPLEPLRTGPVDISFGEILLTDDEYVDYYYISEEQREKNQSRLPLRGLSLTGRLAIVVALFILFLFLSTFLSPLVTGTLWWQFWPLFLLIVGLFFLVVPIRSKYVGAWHAGGLIVAALAVILLPMSLNVLSWQTLVYAFKMFGSFVGVGMILFALGLWNKSAALTMIGAFCFLAFCILGCIFCVLPGAIDASMVPFHALTTQTIPLILD